MKPLRPPDRNTKFREKVPQKVGTCENPTPPVGAMHMIAHGRIASLRQACIDPITTIVSDHY